MENISKHLPLYMAVLFVELIVFFGFVYFVSSKTKDDISRRWKASAVISVFCGLAIHLLFMAIIVLGWIFETDFRSLFANLPEKLLPFASQTIGLAAIITMPTIIFGVFIAYHYLWQTGDRLVEKYWSNPKIHYGENQKPPYLKF